MKLEQPEQKLTIEEQFENPDIIELADKKLEVVDIKPENQKTEVPTMLVPGWTATPETFKDNILDLAELNRRVISINAPHGIDVSEQVENIPEAELRKVAAIAKVLEEKKLEKIDIVAHSEGGLYGTLAATLYPEKVRNLILVDPASMIGKDNPRRLSTDFSMDFLKQGIRSIKDGEARKAVFRLSKESVKAMAKNPMQAVKQVFAMSNSDIRGMLEKLKKQGVGISVIHAVDDKAFPMERMQEMVNTDQVDGFYSIKGTHNEILLNHKRCSELADQALSDLEKKQRK
jgi:pimeloyl-ACP methyl ester carboxylesterase